MLDLILISIGVIALIGGYSWLNRERGKPSEDRFKGTNKIVIYSIMTLFQLAVIFMVYRTDIDAKTYALYMVDFPITALCFAFGWGKYFPHGRETWGGSKLYEEKEFAPADWWANWRHGKWVAGKDEAWIKKWQTSGMNARWFIPFGLVKFPYLAWVFENPWILISSLICSQMGWAYRWAFKDFTSTSLKKAEYLTGALLGLASSVIVITKLFKKKDKSDD